MGVLNISTGGSFPTRNKQFGAIDHGHAHAVAEAIRWLSEEVLPEAIERDHKLHAEGSSPRMGFEKRRIEVMVTAILTVDPAGQFAAAENLDESEERYVRAGASIIAGLFTALGKQTGVAPSRLWREHLRHTLASRESGGLSRGDDRVTSCRQCGGG